MNATEASYVLDAYSELLQRAARVLDEDGVPCVTDVDSLELLDDGRVWVDYTFKWGDVYEHDSDVISLDRLCDE